MSNLSIYHRRSLELLKLRRADDNCQAIYESHHRWLRDQSDELSKSAEASYYLYYATQYDCGKEIVDTILRHKGGENYSLQIRYREVCV